MAKPPDGKRIYARVSEKLSERITSGEFGLGERLPAERELAQVYGVSRPTIREAMIALEVDGLVEVRQGSGIYVRARPRAAATPVRDAGPFDLLEARRAIEGEAAALAAQRITPEELIELDRLVEEMRAMNVRDDIVRSEDVDRRFHALIADASRNTALAAAVDALWADRASSQQSRMLTRKAHAAGVKPRVEEHVAIVAALRAGDAAGARRTMRAHLTRVVETLLDVTEVHEVELARRRVASQREMLRQP